MCPGKICLMSCNLPGDFISLEAEDLHIVKSVVDRHRADDLEFGGRSLNSEFVGGVAAQLGARVSWNMKFEIRGLENSEFSGRGSSFLPHLCPVIHWKAACVQYTTFS